MKWTRREFVAAAGLLGVAGCARIEQSRLGRITPDLEFGKDGPARFAVISDPHLLDSRSVGIVGRAVNAINNDESIDFTVVIGGLTTHGTLQEMNLARHALERLKNPFHCVPGPHDANENPDGPLDFYERAFKKPHWKMAVGGWALVGLNTSNAGNHDQPLADEELAWLAEQADRIDVDKSVALFCHHPLAPDAGDGRLANADAVLETLSGRKLRLVVSGHAHKNSVEDSNGVLHVTTAPCSTTVEAPDGVPGIRCFTLDGEQIQHEFIEVPV